MPRAIVRRLRAESANPINSSVVATALTPIGHVFTVGVSETVWLVAALDVTSAEAQPTLGKFAERWTCGSAAT